MISRATPIASETGVPDRYGSIPEAPSKREEIQTTECVHKR
jgi:hypothetical protein